MPGPALVTRKGTKTTMSVQSAPLSAVGRADHHGPIFRKSSFCDDMTCVEVAAVPGGDILVRDTKNDEDGPVLRFTAKEWVDFLNGVTAGEFTPAALTVAIS